MWTDWNLKSLFTENLWLSNHIFSWRLKFSPFLTQIYHMALEQCIHCAFVEFERPLHSYFYCIDRQKCPGYSHQKNKKQTLLYRAHRFGMTWGWENCHRNVIFGWAMPLCVNPVLVSCKKMPEAQYQTDMSYDLD